MSRIRIKVKANKNLPESELSHSLWQTVLVEVPVQVTDPLHVDSDHSTWED